MKRVTVWLIIITLSLTTAAAARKHRKKGPQAQGTFDYYVLSLSWAPNYCAGHPTDKSAECKTGNRTTFVLHGLWPQSNQGASPMSCAPARPVAEATVRRMLQYYPSRGLIQHEWEKHGTCSGLSAQEYFARAEQAFKAVRVPDRYRSMSSSQTLNVSEVEQDFAAANNAPANAFRISCHSQDLVSVEACLSKDLQYQACGRTVRECPTRSVRVLPPR